MIDFGFAALLAVVSLGTGRRILEWFGQAPEHPLDVAALAIPLGLGFSSLGVLALGELACLNRLGLAVLLAVPLGVGLVPSFRLLRDLTGRVIARLWQSGRSMSGSIVALCLGCALFGTAMVALGPVTDGDALCYHLQVPKCFLLRGSVDFLPDLHETVYPLVTELNYAFALAFRGPEACRWIQWVLGLTFAANVIAIARPALGRRAWWAGAIVLLAPAVSNGMAAPLNDVALAGFGTAAIFAWTRLLDRPSRNAAAVAGLAGGLAIGVKYPALVLVGLLALATGLHAFLAWLRRSPGQARAWIVLTAVYITATAAAGSWWYLRAFHHTGNPVYPYFRGAFGGAGLDEVLDPIKRPLAVTPWNLLVCLGPLTLEPDRFDSFSHQFGAVFLLFLPISLLERQPRRVVGLAALAYLFLAVCMTQRQSMRFLLVALGPMSIAVAYGASLWSDRKTIPAKLTVSLLLAVLGFEALLACARCRSSIGVVLGRESSAALLSRSEPTYVVGRWVGRNLPPAARLIGQDHRGFYFPCDYTMEKAFRRRTGLGRQRETPDRILDRLRESGFTHVLFCPPVPETAVEFDPTLGRLLDSWLAGRSPIYRADLTDGDGVLRRYAIYELARDGLASRAGGDRLR
jgi:hypothetical protein